MRIEVDETHYTIQIEPHETKYEGSFSNPMVAKKHFLSYMEDKFDKEIAHLLQIGTYKLYK